MTMPFRMSMLNSPFLSMPVPKVLGQKLPELPEVALRHEIDLHDDLDLIETVRHGLQLGVVGLLACTPSIGDLEHLLRRQALEGFPKINIRDAVDEDHRVESFFPKASVICSTWGEDRPLERIDLLGLLSLSSLTTSAKAKHEVQHGLLLDVVVAGGVAILQLHVHEEKALLVLRGALLVLDDGLHGGDGVRGLDIQGDRLALGGLHEDLHHVVGAVGCLISTANICIL